MSRGEFSRSEEESLASKYSLLFSLPSHKRIITFIGLLILLLASANYLRTMDALQSLSFFVAVTFSTVAINYILKELLLSDEPILSTRRMNGVSLAQVSFMTLAAIIGAVAELLLAGRELFYPSICFSIATFAYFQVLVYSALSFSGPYISGFSAIAGSLIQITSVCVLSGNAMRLPALLSIFTAAIVLAMITKGLVDSVAERELDITTSLLLRAFIASWASDEDDQLESILYGTGVDAEITSHILLFRDKETHSPLLALLVPNFHPGPFRSLPGSALPHRIQEALEQELGLKALVLHGLSGHGMNIVKSEDAERIVDSIVSTCRLVQNRIFSSKGEKPEQVVVGKVSSLRFKFGDTLLATLTLHPLGMEDIPPIPQVVDSIGLREGKGIPVDAHNSFSDDALEVEEYINDLEELVGELKRRKSEKYQEMFVGFSKVLPKEYDLKDGIGPDGISAVYFQMNGSKSALIVADGNNALPAVREKTLQILQENAVDVGELLTTDNHMVTGLTAGGRGYHPLGTRTSIPILGKYIALCLSEAREKIRPCDVTHLTTTVKGVKVLSEKSISELARVTEKALKRFWITIVSSVLVLLTASVAYCLFL